MPKHAFVSQSVYLRPARILASHRFQSSVGVHAADVAAALAVGHWGSDDSVGSSFGGSGVDTLLSRVIPRFFLSLGSSCSHHDAAWAARVVRRCNFMPCFFWRDTLCTKFSPLHW